MATIFYIEKEETMRILIIEQLFKSEETLEQVLDKMKDDIERIDEYNEMVKTNAYGNAEQVKEIMKQLSGCFGNIRIVLALAETEKKNREVTKKNQIRIDFENEAKTDEKGKLIKFIATVAETEASAFVAPYRRIKNLLLGYKESSEKSISVLQSVLKDENKEYNHPQQ